MGNYNPVYKNLWCSPKFEKLSPNEKLIYLYLITNEKTQQTGVYQILPKQISCDCDLDLGDVKNALSNFEEAKLIKYWPEQNLLFIYDHFKAAKGMIKNPTTLLGCINAQKKIINNVAVWQLFGNEYEYELKQIQDAVNKSLMKHQINKSNNSNEYMDRSENIYSNKDGSKIMDLEQIINNAE